MKNACLHQMVICRKVSFWLPDMNFPSEEVLISSFFILSHKFFNLIKFIIFSPPIVLHFVTLPRNFRTILYSVCLTPLHEINWESFLSILTPPCMLFFILKTAVSTHFSDLQFIYNWLAVLMLLHWIPHHILPMSCSLWTRLINADAVTPLRGNLGVENHSA